MNMHRLMLWLLAGGFALASVFVGQYAGGYLRAAQR